MSAASDVINPQNVPEIAQIWKGVHLNNHDTGKPAKLQNAEASSSSDELSTKVRKPYTITKQRERWTETEHQKFLEALKLYGRAWRRIEEYIGTKTAVQIRSHAQKFFSKLEREASIGSSAGKLSDISIPPPRPKRKPSHPYPKKAGSSLSLMEDESKEGLFLLSAGGSAARSEGFRVGFLNSSLSQGVGAPPVAEIPVAHGRCFDDQQGSLRIFGKMVSIAKSDKGGFYAYPSSDRLGRDDNAVASKPSSSPRPSENMVLPSLAEVRTCVNSFSETALYLNRSAFLPVITQPEGTGESAGGAGGHDLSGGDVEVGESVHCCGGECKVRGDGCQGKPECRTFAGSLKEGAKENVELPLVMNPLILNWMNNVFHHQNGNPVPSTSINGAIEVPSSSSMSYWQFLQASAMNYAAYTAAMAAAAVAGWKAPNSGGTDSTNDGQLPAVPSLPWWPYGRFMSPLYFPHPRNTPQQGDVSNTVKCSVVSEDDKKDEVLEDSHPQGYKSKACLTAAESADCLEPAMDPGCLKGAETACSCEPDLDAGGGVEVEIEDHLKTVSSTGMCSRLETSSPRQASVKVLPDPDSQGQASAIMTPVKGLEQSNDTGMRDTSISPPASYSSSDEFEEQAKKLREGSSSGSNTPASRYRSSEWDAPVIPDSRKRDCYVPSEDNEDGWSDAFRVPPSQRGLNTTELPDQRVKHVEKGKRHQQKDARHGAGGDSKRFKTCAHEVEVRKEVSQEGRKAFQALFASKSLPQTFPSAGCRELAAEDELVSGPSAYRDEMESTGCCECITVEGASEEKPTREFEDIHNAGMEISSHRQPGLAGPKGFTISSSSGFVPYRKPVCLEPSKVSQNARETLGGPCCLFPVHSSNLS